MLISDVLHGKGQHEVIKIRTFDSLADAVAKQYLQVANTSDNRAQLQSQLDNAQRQLAVPTTPPDAVADLQGQVADLQSQLAQDASTSDLAAIVAPAFSQTAPVFPNTLITLAIGALVGAAAAALIGTSMVKAICRPSGDQANEVGASGRSATRALAPLSSHWM